MRKIAVVVLLSLGFVLPSFGDPQNEPPDAQMQADNVKHAITAVKRATAQLSERGYGKEDWSVSETDTPRKKALEACKKALQALEKSPPDLDAAIALLKDANEYSKLAEHDKGGHLFAGINSIREAINRLEATAPTNAEVVRVFFATDRAQTQAQFVDFGPKRGDGALKFGSFDVSIPRDHRMANIERPTMWKFEFSENPEKHFVIVGRNQEDEAAFYTAVRQTVNKSKEKADRALRAVNGKFYVSFPGHVP